MSNTQDSSSGDKLSPSKKSDLIELVKNVPCLWNPMEESYRFADKRDREWSKIAEHLEISSACAKKTWDNLRGQYVRIKKAKQQASGSAAVNVPVWNYFSQLGFLAGIVRPRQTCGNVITSEGSQTRDASAEMSVESPEQAERNSENDNGDSPATENEEEYGRDQGNVQHLTSSRTTQRGRAAGSLKRRFQASSADTISDALMKEISKNPDEDQLFGDFIAAGLRKLSRRLKITTRMQIQQVLSNAEICQMDNESSMPPLASYSGASTLTFVQPGSSNHGVSTASQNSQPVSGGSVPIEAQSPMPFRNMSASPPSGYITTMQPMATNPNFYA